MLDRLIAIVRRITRWEIATLVLVALSPFVVLAALAVGVWLDEPVSAVLVVGGFLVLVAIVGAIAIAWRLRLRARFRASRAPRTSHAAAPGKPGSRLVGDARVLDEASRLPRRALHNFGVRTQSTWVRDVLAHRITDGRLDFQTLVRAIRASNEGNSSIDRLVLGDVDQAALVDLARMMSSQDLSARERTWYQAILDYLGASATKLKVVHEQQLILAERLILADRIELARPLVEKWATTGTRERMLAADVLNPALASGSPSEAREQLWLGTFNQIFRASGIEPVTLLSDGPTLFDRLSARATERVAGGPLVSIVMTCFRPGEELVTAVRSVIAQSWSNWELLVMDDASPAEHSDVLDRVAEMDARVRVVRAEENAGTYVRRNDAMALAQGEFVTMQDSDDWAHPRRVELQVKALMAEPALIANLSECVRTSEDLAFAQGRGAKLRPAETSLVFRREPVIERIGYYDAVRKAADSEYRLRLEAAFDTVVPILDAGSPLSLVRYLPQSLSGSDFRDGWVHPSRIAYRSASWAWHERIRAGEADPRLSHPMETRPFVAPPRLLAGDQERHELDVLVLLDGRATASPLFQLERLGTELAQLATSRRVGIQQIDALGPDASLGVTGSAIQRLVDDGLITRVLEGEGATVGAVLVRNASLIQGLEPVTSPITTDRVIVLEDLAGERDKVGVTFSRSYVMRTLSAMFGTSPDYVKVDDVIDFDALLAPQDTRSDDETDANALRELVERYSPSPELPEATGWAARGGTLLALVDAAMDLPTGSTIVEAGSGRSTFWLAVASARQNRHWRIVALEHEHQFAEETRGLLAEHDLTGHAEVVLAPLEEYTLAGADYHWYAKAALDGLSDIRLLFVDGPPSNVGGKARYPAFPLLRDLLADGCLIVVDDAQRHDERLIVDEWLAESGESGHLELERYEGRAAFLRFRR